MISWRLPDYVGSGFELGLDVGVDVFVALCDGSVAPLHVLCYERASEFICFFIPSDYFKKKGKIPKTKGQMAWVNRLVKQGKVATIKTRTPFKLGECDELCWFIFFKKVVFVPSFFAK